MRQDSSIGSCGLAVNGGEALSARPAASLISGETPRGVRGQLPQRLLTGRLHRARDIRFTTRADPSSMQPRCAGPLTGHCLIKTLAEGSPAAARGPIASVQLLGWHLLLMMGAPNLAIPTAAAVDRRHPARAPGYAGAFAPHASTTYGTEQQSSDQRLPVRRHRRLRLHSISATPVDNQPTAARPPASRCDTPLW